jgi:hypothetical protein
MIQGSCLCGSTTFTIDGALTAARFCHCRNCTKFAGTSPASWALAASSDLTVDTSGPVTKFDSGRGLRCFCSNCGAPLWFESLEHPEIVAVPLGALDAGEVPAPEFHLWTKSMPDWCSIDDDLPQHETYPESLE